MTAQHPLFRQWQQRLAKLNRLIEIGARGVWQYEIRAKILNYFISRYGRVDGKFQFSGRTTVANPARTVVVPAQPRPSELPNLKSRAQIRSLLEDIRRIHRSSKDR